MFRMFVNNLKMINKTMAILKSSYLNIIYLHHARRSIRITKPQNVQL
jgi:hypothetical protein